MLRRALLGLVAALLPGVVLGAEPARLKVLFLGDRGHHKPAERAGQVQVALENRGIDLTYTEKTDDLNPETLGKYDALLVYANIDQIEPAQEKALLEYVASGGGFVPVHCASFCFRNSDAYVALVGAQFLRHTTGEFETKIVDPEHPIMQGFEPFRTWDETYVHSKHNEKDRTVLQVRDEQGKPEPWTWVRTHGKGRVFYTAYGHDERTWGQYRFQDLLERGIRWAANKGRVFDSRPRVAENLPPFEYDKANIPLYLPGKRFGAENSPFNKMQRPASPAESVKHMVVPEGFEPRLFASEPEIHKPLCMAWDHKGRLWISETVDYPNNLKRVGEGADQIKICEDTDGDGKADKFTVFADKLSIPTAIAFANGGIVIHQAPNTLFLKDTDGDGKADERKVLFTGWGTQDTHAGPSNLRWGFDNWLWGMVGYSGFQGNVGGENVSFRMGFYRFRPDGSKLEFLRSTNNNTWGGGFTEEGLVFGSTANNCPSVYMPIPNRFYESVRGWSATVLTDIADTPRFFPITDRVRQVDCFGNFTAGAGHAVYTARTYPEWYWNKTAFEAEPTGHLVATFALERRGSDFVSHNAWNLLASNDEWTAPTMAEVGPDGNVWVIDWYNFIVQHNPTPEGYKTGKGGAYETPLRDKTHGRVYRIVWKGAKEPDTRTLDPADEKGLLKALGSDNQLWRMHAQRLLVERGKRDVVPALVEMLGDRSVDAVGLNTRVIHALGALRGLRAIEEENRARRAVVSALKHPSAGVRRNALEALPRDEAAAREVLASGCLDDGDAQVRLTALLGLAECPAAKGVGEALSLALVKGSFDGDRWLGDALTSAAAKNDREFLEALAERKLGGRSSALAATVAGRVAEHYARGGPVATVVEVLASLKAADAKVADAVVGGIVKGWPRGKEAGLNEADEKQLMSLYKELSVEAKGQLVTLTSRWRSRLFDRYTAEIAAGLLETAKNESKPDAARTDAARQLIGLRRSDAEAARELVAAINPRTSTTLASGILDAVSQSESAKVGAELAAALPGMTPSVRPAALRALLARPDWTAALLDGMEHGELAITQLALDQRQALAAHPDSSIAARARKLMQQGGGLPDADRQKVIDTLGPVVLKTGDAAHGKDVFKQNCAKCHIHSGEGGKVGPDLTGMAAHPKAELLVHILDPSRSVEGNFIQYTVATNDGRVLNGLLASESRTSVEVIDSEGKSHAIQRSDIEEMRASKKSVMPEGFEKQVAPKDLADLLEFLTQRGKFLPLDLRKVATIVSTRGMFYDKDGGGERLIFRDWGPKTFEGVPFHLVDPQGDKVPNVVMLYGPIGNFPPKMPRSVMLPCNAPAKAIHLLSGVSGWGAQGPDAPKTVSMIVRLHYADGKVEDHPLRNGVEFADYIRVIDVPGSKLAFKLRDQQIRYLAVTPKRPKETIREIELVKGPDQTAPVVMAVTVEGAD